MKELQKLINTIQTCKDIYPDITMRQFRIFLETAIDPGQTQFHYARKCQESEALVSRTVTKLSEFKLFATGYRPDGRSKSLLIGDGGNKLLGVLYENFKQESISQK